MSRLNEFLQGNMVIRTRTKESYRLLMSWCKKVKVTYSFTNDPTKVNNFLRYGNKLCIRVAKNGHLIAGDVMYHLRIHKDKVFEITKEDILEYFRELSERSSDVIKSNLIELHNGEKIVPQKLYYSPSKQTYTGKAYVLQKVSFEHCDIKKVTYE